MGLFSRKSQQSDTNAWNRHEQMKRRASEHSRQLRERIENGTATPQERRAWSKGHSRKPQ
ncbi:hypothetical protein [Streptomyces sp. NPDC005009]